MRCLVVGGAECVWEDADRATELSEFDGVIAVKRIVEVWPGPLCAFVSLHADTMAASIRKRRAKGLPMGFKSFCDRRSVSNRGYVDEVLTDWGGSSGLFGVKVALHLGYTRIVVAGMPLDVRPHFNKPETWRFAPGYTKGWRLHETEIAPYVRSMSGWTRQHLGAPTQEWLNADLPAEGTSEL